MAHKMVIHAGNYKKGSVGALQHHNFRENETYSNHDINRERTKDNLVIKQPDMSQYQDTRRTIEKRAVNQIRSNAIWQSEFIISSDKGFFGNMPVGEQNRFFQESYNYLCDFFGEENVTCAVVHYDESTPHMHFDFVPMTAENKLSRKEVMTRERLIRIQDEMPKYLQEKGFSVERGRKMANLEFKDRPKHIEPKEYKKALQGQMRALEKQEKEIHDKAKEMAGLEETLKKYQKEIRTKAFDYNNQLKDISEIPKGEKNFTGKMTLPEEEYKKLVSTARNGIVLRGENKALKKSVQSLLQEKEKLEKQIPTTKEKLRINEKLVERDRLEQDNIRLKEQMREVKNISQKIIQWSASVKLPEAVGKLFDRLKKVLEEGTVKSRDKSR